MRHMPAAADLPPALQRSPAWFERAALVLTVR